MFVIVLKHCPSPPGEARLPIGRDERMKQYNLNRIHAVQECDATKA
jgi:hypothetical protein